MFTRGESLYVVSLSDGGFMVKLQSTKDAMLERNLVR